MAPPPVLFTPEQLHRVRLIIERYHAAIAVSVFGADALPEVIVEQLRAAGVPIPEGPLLLADSYAYGQLLANLLQPSLATESPEEIRARIERNQIPPTPAEEAAQAYAAMHGAQYVTGLAHRVSADAVTEITGEESQLTPEDVKRIIADEVAAGVSRRDAVERIRSNLGHEIQNWTRDWKRIAQTEVGNAIFAGEADVIERHHGKEARVCRVPRPDACPDCKRLYLDKDGNPKIFRLSELRANGSNVGRHRSAWKPVLEATHPWCACDLMWLPDGAYWEDGDLKIQKSKAPLRKGAVDDMVNTAMARVPKLGPVYFGPRGGKYRDPAHKESARPQSSFSGGPAKYEIPPLAVEEFEQRLALFRRGSPELDLAVKDAISRADGGPIELSPAAAHHLARELRDSLHVLEDPHLSADPTSAYHASAIRHAVSVLEGVRKAFDSGPFIGPRGGKWADPQHTTPWHPTAPQSPPSKPKVDTERLLQGNLGIPRIDMPQIKAALVPDFIAHVEKHGAHVTRERVPVSTLKSTQNELKADKIQHEVEVGDIAHLSKPVIVSHDDFLLDGHHRWAARRTLDEHAEQDVIRVSMPIVELLKLAHSFGGVSYKKSVDWWLAGLDEGFTPVELLRKSDYLNLMLDPPVTRSPSIAGNEGTPQKDRAPAIAAGSRDLYGVSEEQQKKKRKRRKKRSKEAKGKKYPLPVEHPPPMERELATAEDFVPEETKSLKRAARGSRKTNIDRYRTEVERKKKNNENNGRLYNLLDP
jgi:hypothetical protein